MKIEFKITAMNLISFLMLGTLFFWLFPFPKSHIWSDAIGFVGVLVLIFICFVVVSRKPLLRKGTPSAANQPPAKPEDKPQANAQEKKDTPPAEK